MNLSVPYKFNDFCFNAVISLILNMKTIVTLKIYFFPKDCCRGHAVCSS